MAATGFAPATYLPLFNGRQTTGAAIPAAATTGTFGCTVGTLDGSGAAGQTAQLISEVANNANKTDTVIFDMTVPNAAFIGATFSLVVTARHTRAGGSGTATIDASVRQISSAGVSSAELVSTAAQTLTVGSTVAYTFTVDSTGFDIGDRITIAIQAALTVGDANNNSVTIYSVKLSD